MPIPNPEGTAKILLRNRIRESKEEDEERVEEEQKEEAEEDQSPEGNKWAAAPLPCFTYV